MRRWISVGNTTVVRGLREKVSHRFGEDSAMAFLEAIGNVVDHCPEQRCRVTISAWGWKVQDRGPGIGDGQTRKPAGVEGFAQGGFGLQIIRSLGGRVLPTTEGTVVLWTAPGWRPVNSGRLIPGGRLRSPGAIRHDSPTGQR